MMLLCSDADQGQADTEHQSSDVKQIIWLEGVVNVREHKRQPPVISSSKYRWLGISILLHKGPGAGQLLSF